MRILKFMLGFPLFYLSSRTWKAIHSPYLFRFFQFVFDNERKYYIFDAIERLRENLLFDDTIITFQDHGGRGKTAIEQSKRVRQAARTSLSGSGHCAVRFRIALMISAKNMLELGTSFGISTAYLASTGKNVYVDTIDASESHIRYARGIARALKMENITFHCGEFEKVLPSLLVEGRKFDYVILDGNHRKAPTLKYFELILPALSDNAVILVDDIRWSDEMLEAWRHLKGHARVGATVDLYRYGLLFMRNAFKEPLHVRALSSRLTPWEYF